jgi:hypothetical protein
MVLSDPSPNNQRWQFSRTRQPIKLALWYMSEADLSRTILPNESPPSAMDLPPHPMMISACR